MKNKHKKEQIPSSKIIVFLVLVTSVVVITFSISKFETMLKSQTSATVAKWNIDLTTNNNEDVIFENNATNEQSFILKIKSESEVSSKYDIQIQGIYTVYNMKLANDTYDVGYEFSDDKLVINTNNDEIIFDINANSQDIICNENKYHMEKSNSNKEEYITIKNETLNKDIIDFKISNTKEMQVVYKNCMEFIKSGEHEDTYNLTVSTNAKELPAESSMKIHALFEQID